MRRVMIIGQPGSGKSTLARAIGAITHLPVIHADHLHWTNGWVERSQAEKTALFEAAALRPEWVFEGNHSRTMQMRLARADTLIWIDLPLPLRSWRILKRLVRWYGRSRPDLPEGCPEHLNLAFLSYIWRTRASGRTRCAGLLAQAPTDMATHHLRAPSHVSAYLADLRHAARSGNLGISHR